MINGKQLYKLAGHSDTISSVSFNNDGKLIATGNLIYEKINDIDSIL